MTILRVIIFAFVICGSLFAQSTHGTIDGTVRDLETQELLMGANVYLKSPEGKDLSYGAATDTAGHFVIVAIPIGVYTVNASLVGYQRFQSALFRLSADSVQHFQIRLDPYFGLTAEDARQDIRNGIIRIYMWSGMIGPSQAHHRLAKMYGFEIGNTGCTPFRTERYDSVMISYLTPRNGIAWFQRFLQEWKTIKW